MTLRETKDEPLLLTGFDGFLRLVGSLISFGSFGGGANAGLPSPKDIMKDFLSPSEKDFDDRPLFEMDEALFEDDGSLPESGVRRRSIGVRKGAMMAKDTFVPAVGGSGFVSSTFRCG